MRNRLTSRAITPGLLVIGILLWIVSVVHARTTPMGVYGLISQVGVTFYGALLCLGLAAGWELSRTPVRATPIFFITLFLVTVLFGTSPATTQVAALTDSYVHTGFTNYIIQHGAVLQNFDARFSWPGAFALGGVVARAAGVASTLSFLKWFPLVIELAYLAPLWAIGRVSGVPRRTAYLGTLLFYTGNWIYQDYFSPQALNFLFYLTLLAVVMTLYRAATPPRRERWRRALDTWRLRRVRGLDAVSRLPRQREVALLIFGALLATASAVSHQLTPYAMVLSLIALLGARRLGRPELVVVTAVVTIGWLSLGAYNFWVGHLSLIFGSLGSVGSTLGSNVGSRVFGAPSHLLVVKWRIYATGLMFLLAGVGVLRRAADDRALELLAGAPFALLLAQSYGGEGLLRATLFSLPFTSLLAASAFLPRRSGPISPWISWSTPLRHRLTRPLISVMVTALIVVTVVLLVFVRGGNDYYETYTSGELSAVNYLDTHVPTGSLVGTFSAYVPLGASSLTTYRVYIAVLYDDASVATDLARLNRAHPQFLLLTQSEEHWGDVVMGYPAGWEQVAEQTLLRHHYRVVFHNSTASVLERVP